MGEVIVIEGEERVWQRRRQRITRSEKRKRNVKKRNEKLFLSFFEHLYKGIQGKHF